jgi:hypothetical protein
MMVDELLHAPAWNWLSIGRGVAMLRPIATRRPCSFCIRFGFFSAFGKTPVFFLEPRCKRLVVRFSQARVSVCAQDKNQVNPTYPLAGQNALVSGHGLAVDSACWFPHTIKSRGRERMKKREALSLFAGLAILALTSAASGAPRAGSPGDDNPDVVEVRHYHLTLDKAEKTGTAMQSINQLIASNPSLSAAMDAGSDTTGKKPITQQAQDIDTKYPQVAAIIHANGLATREFIVITGAIINDAGFVGLKKQGLISSYPANSIIPENAALVEQNWDKFQAIMAKMTPPNIR